MRQDLTVKVLPHTLFEIPLPVVPITLCRLRPRTAARVPKIFRPAFLLAALSIVSPISSAYASAPSVQHPPKPALQHRLDAQRAAVQSGQADAIIASSRAVVAIALRQVAEFRVQGEAYLQALAVAHSSLLIEDAAETRAVLASAERGATDHHLEIPKDVGEIDPYSLPTRSVLNDANLNATAMDRERQREKELRRILSAAYNDWGTAEANEQQYLSAMVHFQEAEHWDPSTHGLMRNIGLSAAKIGDNREAVRALKLAVKNDPADKQSRSMLAVAQFASGEYADAARSFSLLGDSVLVNPEMAYAWAFSLSRTNQMKQARLILNKLPEPTLSAEMLVLIGKVHNDLGDYTQALRCFKSAVQRDPTLKQAHGGAGVALIHLNRPADALPELEAELKLNATDPDSRYQLAHALLQLSRPDEALPILRALVASHPDHPRARYQLGKITLEKGQMDEAIQNLEAAAELDPDRAYVHYQLQKAYRQTGNSEAANRELKLYQQLKERDRQRIVINAERLNQSEDSTNQ